VVHTLLLLYLEFFLSAVSCIRVVARPGIRRHLPNSYPVMDRIVSAGCRSTVEDQIAFLPQLFAIPTTLKRIQQLIVITTEN